MELADNASLPAIAGDLQQMINSFKSQELWGRLTGAKECFRELDFALRLGPAALRGQIDMLYVDAGGSGHIVDYKSDRLDGDEDLDDHCRRYELQMLIYALAAQAHLSAPPANATLYFLRSGRAHPVEMTAEALKSAEERICELCRRLIAARRSGHFPRLDSAACDGCPYGWLCRNQ